MGRMGSDIWEKWVERVHLDHHLLERRRELPLLRERLRGAQPVLAVDHGPESHRGGGVIRSRVSWGFVTRGLGDLDH